MAPAGSIEVLAGARVELAMASTSAISTQMATQPLERRANLSIVNGPVNFSTLPAHERIFRQAECHSFSYAAVTRGMRPLTVLIGIVMGSAVSLAVGLGMTWITLLFLPEYAAQLVRERAPLAQAIAIFALISAAAGVSFYGEVRERRWRFSAHAVTVLALGFAVWEYWPRRG